MPHFFLPINWPLTSVMIISTVFIMVALIFWTSPSLKFPLPSHSNYSFSGKWMYISESAVTNLEVVTS